MNDHVDFVIEQWLKTMPDADVSSMGVIGRMIRILKHGERIRAKALGQFGFKDGEFDVLATLRRAGEPYRLTPTVLYRSLLITSGAITNRLAHLEKAGLIKRGVDEYDKRSSYVELTPLGLSSIEKALKIHLEVQDAILSPLSNEQKKELSKLLRIVLSNLPDENN